MLPTRNYKEPIIIIHGLHERCSYGYFISLDFNLLFVIY